jgi:uncharacterized membrane protein YeaQ/YmgE (transglycosylase-associated protein family)
LAFGECRKGKRMSGQGLIIWIIIGAIAGWLAGLIVQGGGFGVLGDIVVGIVGSLIAGALFGAFLPGFGAGVLGAIVSATIGAVILLFLFRLLRRAA